MTIAAGNHYLSPVLMSKFIPILIALLPALAQCRKNDDNKPQVQNQAVEVAGPLIETIAGHWSKDTVALQPSDWIHVEQADSLYIGGYHLIFEPAQGTFQPYYQDQEIRDSISARFGDAYQAARAIEHYLIDSLGMVRRDGDTLWIYPEQELQFRLVNKKGLSYCLENYDQQLHLFLIKIFFQRGSAYLMVNGKNGFASYLWGRPYLSPDSTMLMVINNDQKVQYSANGMQLFTLQGDSLTLQWSQGIENWGPMDLKWIGQDSLIIRREYIAYNESEEVYITDEVLLRLTTNSPPL